LPPKQGPYEMREAMAALLPPNPLDLVFTVGAYDLLAMALRSFAVELDSDLQSWK
jgi:hypothetical protein